MEITAATIPISDVEFSVTREIVGDADRTNVATFTFTPKTKLSSLGGAVRITTPLWYESEKNPELPYEEKNFECASTSFATIGRQRAANRGFRDRNGNRFKVYWYEIPYSALVPYPATGTEDTLQARLLAAETRPVTLVCSYWRNPILPEVSTGYQLTTEDYDGAPIDDSESFTLDASAFVPFPIPDANVVYTLSTPTVQTPATYHLQITTPVPLEIDPDGGCYVKFNFPDELLVKEAELTAYAGGYLMVAKTDTVVNGAGTDEITSEVVDSDLTSASGKYVIVRGCHGEGLAAKPKSILQIIDITFTAISNPYSVRHTGGFKVQVFRNWDAASKTASLQIIETNAEVPGSKYAPGPLSGYELTASNRVVQEATEHTHKFT